MINGHNELHYELTIQLKIAVTLIDCLIVDSR